MLNLEEQKRRKTIVQANDKLVVSMLMLDAGQRVVADRAPVIAANHRPGFAVLSDADKAKRQTLYADSNRALSDRWKSPAPLPLHLMPKAPAVIPTAPAATRDAAYSSYDANLSQRWKGAAA